MLAGHFAKLRGFLVKLIGPQHRHRRAVTQVRCRVLLVEVVALVALDPLTWVVAVEVQPWRLRSDLNADVQPKVIHVQVLSQMDCNVE
ncbi:hypothetical protein D3C71_2080210 [compost metagenome]